MNSPGSPDLTFWQSPVFGSRHGSSVSSSTRTRVDLSPDRAPESSPNRPMTPLPNELRDLFHSPAAPSVAA
jgi:hypothetical protein